MAAAFVLAGLAVYVGLYETKPKEDEKERIYQVEPEDIASFELEDLEKQLTLACERSEDGDWLITKPSRLIAEDETVEMVVRNLANPVVDRKFEPAEDLTPFGLDSPVYKASFRLKDGKTRILLVGAKNPTGSAYFIKEQDQPGFYTAAAYSVDGFMKTVKDLRGKTLMKFEPAGVSRLVLERPGSDTLEFKRLGVGSWEIVKPVQAPADGIAVEGLLNDAKSLKGTEVIEEPDAYSRYKLDQPVAKITVYTGTGTGQRLFLSKPKTGGDDAYASSSRLPFVFKLGSSYAATAALKPLNDFRERLLLQADRDDLAHVTVKTQGMDIVCTKDKDGKWTVSKPEGRSLDDEFDEMLFEITYVRAEEFIAGKPGDLTQFGLAPAKAEIILTGQREKEPFSAKYLLGKRSGDNVYCKLSERPDVYAVRKDLLDKVDRFADRIRTGAAEPAAEAGAKTAEKAN